jgi:cell division protein FtsW
VSARTVHRDARAQADHGDGNRWPAGAIALTVITVLLMLLGLLMSFSASIVDAAQEGDAFGTFRRQAMWALVSLPVFAVATRFPRRLLRPLSWPLIVVTIALLVLVLVPGVGVTRFGSTRWLGFGGFVFQPSEVAKLALLLWLADVLERKRPSDGSLHETSHLLIPAVPALVLVGGLVMVQPDLGTTVLLGLIVGAMLFIEGIRLRFLMSGLVLAAGAVALLVLVAPYRVARIRGWLYAEEFAQAEGFQLMQSWVALGSGGVFGLGLGSSRGKWNFVPNPETDFVFAIIGEELGLIGATGLILLFVTLLLLGLHVAFTAAPGFDRTLAFTVTTWVVGQGFVNIGTVIGLLPITGVTLPLVSAGGSSLLVTMVALGLLINVARIPGGAPVAAGHDRRRP